ncbi:MAG: glycosyltransferase [Chloroflexia bacterium]
MPPETETGTLTLVVCTYCRPLQVKRLLVALQCQSLMPDEVLLVDGSPDDETERIASDPAVRGAIPSLLYHRVPPEHRGLTRQRNYGIEHARGSIVAFLDDDTMPEPDYFSAIASCFRRHPEAAGVGGYITNEVAWRHAGEHCSNKLSIFCWRGWERREDYRWRVRRIMGLAGSYAPGWVPPSGHGRPVGFLPPDGQDYQVEFFMGGVSAWRREVLQRVRFSHFFEGYGLYEDLDFCLRVARHQPLYLCTSARIEHYHAQTSRPGAHRYGVMVVRNGWYVWRQRWPNPLAPDRLRWWAITLLLAVSRLFDAARGPHRRQALMEALGRFRGMFSVLLRAPRPAYSHDANEN